MPGFASPNKVNRGYFWPKSFIGRSICIGSRWSGVIRKAEPVPVSSSPFIQQPLVCAIPGSLLLEQIRDLLELVFPG